jgi:methionyl-tRNA synthetase
MKVQRAAAKADADPKLFCDKGASIFKELSAKAGVEYDHFIRTTDPDHREAVQYAWGRLQRLGHIYESKHEGWYSVTDETFYPESAVQLVLEPSSGRKMMVSTETGAEVEWSSETNYRFRLSEFQQPLLNFYEKNPEWVYPMARMNMVTQSVKEGLEDLSISRPSSRLSWGIPVPDDPSQTIYVWLDALVNYITKAGYPFTPGREHEGGWPADVHVIGKDIIRFHCIYWPAFLQALNLPLPRRVLTHAHWTMDHQKMSKSVGNVVNPFFALERFGEDPMRFYLAHDGGLENDSDYSNYHIIERYKKCLQGGLGNLASRIMRGKGWNVRTAVESCVNTVGQGQVWPQAKADEIDTHARQIQLLQEVSQRVEQRMSQNNVPGAVKEIMEIIFEVGRLQLSLYSDPSHVANMSQTNRYVAEMQPWSISGPPQSNGPNSQANRLIHLSETEQHTLNTTIFLAAEALRISGILLSPVMPGRMSKLLDMLGVDTERRVFDYATLGKDERYGTSWVKLGKGLGGTLFPPLTSSK